MNFINGFFSIADKLDNFNMGVFAGWIFIITVSILGSMIFVFGFWALMGAVYYYGPWNKVKGYK